MTDRLAPATIVTPRHVMQRRSDGMPCFFNDEDYLVYLDCLKDAAERYECAVHAYVLMPDHVQLLLGLDSETRLMRLLSRLGTQYVEYVNYTYQRTGEFWAQAPSITPIGTEQDVLEHYREIETVPVQAHLVPGPADYRWSSHRHHSGGCEDAVIRDHPVYLGLGTTQLARQLTYRAMFQEPSEGEARAAWKRATGRDPVLDAGRLEDGIRRTIRGVAWQTRAGIGRRMASK
jgi:putative transposase